MLQSRAFQISAKQLGERRFHAKRYAAISGNSDLIRLLANKIVEAARREENLCYSDWIVGHQFKSVDGRTLTISSPPWTDEEKRFVHLVLEYLALWSGAKHGFMMTVLIVNAKGELVNLPSKGFSFLEHEVGLPPLRRRVR